MSRPETALKHGVANTYSRHGCRCEPCTTANAEYSHEWRARRRRAANPPDPLVCGVCNAALATHPLTGDCRSFV